MRNRITIMVMAVVIILASQVKAEDTFWVGTTGDWLHPTNWQYKVPERLPESDDVAYIDNGGTAEISISSANAEHIRLGYSNGNSGTINHTGGTCNALYLVIGYQDQSTGTYDLSETGLLNATYPIIGYNGTGNFNQSNGTNSSTNTHVGYLNGSIGTYTFSDGIHSASKLYLGTYIGSDGTYNLSGTAELTSTDQEIIGREGAGTFSQSGGTNVVNGGLMFGELSGSYGRYSISSGILSTQELQVGSQGTGRFDIDSSVASITVSDNFLFGTDSTFTAVANSVIHMEGSLDNWNTDETDLSGLNNLSLVFEGGAASGVGTFEVAGKDLGAVMLGFEENFALDELILGGSDIGEVQLVDWRDNMTGIEALYVKNFVLGSGSYLDLNGLNLYYQTFTDLGGMINFNGGEMSQVPEPATLLLLGIGTAMLRRNERKLML